MGLCLLLLLLLPLRLHMASDVDTFWIDEAYTILVAERPLSAIMAITSLDAHPPSYYLLTKAVFILADVFGLKHDIFLIRLPGFLAFFLLVSVAWVLGRRSLGNWGGSLFAIVLAFNASVSSFTSEARNYGLLMLFLATAFLLLAEAWRLEQEGLWTRRRAILVWGAQALCAALALWTHLLSAVALLFLGLFWVVLVLFSRNWKGAFFLGGLASYSAAVLAFVPWLLRVHQQLNYLSGTDTPWMTPPTVENLLRVYTFWHSFGRFDPAVEGAWLPVTILSFLVLAPLAALAASLLLSRDRIPWRDWVIPLGGLAVATCYVTTIWLFTRLGIAKVFHGPRYPVLTLPIWYFAMVGLSLAAVARLGFSRWMALLLVAPILAMGVAGLYATERRSSERGRRAQIAELASLLPPEGTILHVSPTSLTPYLEEIFPRHVLRPIEDIGHHTEEDGMIDIVLLKYWMHIQDGKSRLLYDLLEQGSLGSSARVVHLTENRKDLSDFSLHRLVDVDDDLIDRILHGPDNIGPLPLGEALSVASPEDQLFFDGFSTLDLADDGLVFCWAAGRESRIRFDTPISPGDYLVTVVIGREPFPEPMAEVALRFEEEGTVIRETLAEGRHVLQFPFTVTRHHQRPTLRLLHPTWRPSDHIEVSEDTRRLTFRFLGATIHPAKP
jgi:hypothetical protein